MTSNGIYTFEDGITEKLKTKNIQNVAYLNPSDVKGSIIKAQI